MPRKNQANGSDNMPRATGGQGQLPVGVLGANLLNFQGLRLLSARTARFAMGDVKRAHCLQSKNKTNLNTQTPILFEGFRPNRLQIRTQRIFLHTSKSVKSARCKVSPLSHYISLEITTSNATRKPVSQNSYCEHNICDIGTNIIFVQCFCHHGYVFVL